MIETENIYAHEFVKCKSDNNQKLTQQKTIENFAVVVFFWNKLAIGIWKKRVKDSKKQEETNN